MDDPSAWVASSDKHDISKHHQERIENGFSTYDWWNFCDYIAWVNIQALEKFKTGVGYPAQLSSQEEWGAILDTMIEGFEAHLKIANLDLRAGEYPQLMRKRDTGLSLYAKYFNSLWD